MMCVLMNSSTNESVNNLSTSIYPPWSIPIICSLSILGLCGNILVCFTVWKANFLHTTTNYLIVNLAITDSFVCIFSALQLLWNKLGFPNSEIAQNIFCHLLSSEIFLWLSSTGSSFALVLVSLERFIGIVHPLHYRLLITPKRVRIALILQWITALIAETYLAVLHIYDGKENGCVFKINVAFYFLQIIINYVFPVAALIYLYYKMFLSLRMTRNNPFEARRKQNRRARNNILINLFIVTVLFVAFWTPSQVVFLLRNYLNTSLNDVTYVIAVYILTLCNSIVNPIVYCFRYKQFQKALRIHVLPFLRVAKA